MVKRKAYIHFGGLPFGKVDDPRCTVEVEVKEELLPWQRRGLMYTATGYGSRIPITYMVRWSGRWRRVYAMHYSNASTLYIESKRKPLAVVDIY